MKLQNNLYTTTGWEITEDVFNPEEIVTTGSNFMVGNGYLGYRGTFEEWEQDCYVACIVSDTYDTADGKWRELCNAPNGLYTKLIIANEEVSLFRHKVSHYKRSLNFKNGLFSRQFRWQCEERQAEIESERFASYDNLHLLPLKYRFQVLQPAEVTLVTGIDGRVWNLNGEHFATCQSLQLGTTLAMTATTVEEGILLCVAEGIKVSGKSPLSEEVLQHERQILHRLRFQLAAGETVEMEKVVAVYSSKDVAEPQEAAKDAVEAGLRCGYGELKSAHERIWMRIWDTADVQIEGDLEAQVAMHFCLFHNRIATPVHSDHLPVGARGLSCQAYQGAAFWDQEIFNLPVFLFTEPEIARNLLLYRYKTINGARRKARRRGYQGAFYAWISGSTGEELCPSYFFRDVLTGRKIRNHFNDWQIHISPDIVYATWQYYQATADWLFIVEYGAEIIFEVARFLVSFAYFKEDKDRYEFLRVLGPDEYHEGVNNNAFTNYQAQFTLQHAALIYRQLQETQPAALATLAEQLRLDEAEVQTWERMAKLVFLPTPDPHTLLIEQFDGYFELEDTTPEVVKSRLLDPGEYWGWPNGVAVATQVIKQADVIQLFCLHDTFSCDVMKANYDYYQPRCQHGSSLSYSAYAIIAKRAGYLDQAYEYFMKTSTVDLYNTAKAISGGTFIGGIHTAACAGAWQVAVVGFGGLTLQDEMLCLDPILPKEWKKLAFKLAYRGGTLAVQITPDCITLIAHKANPKPLPTQVYGNSLMLIPGNTETVAYTPHS